MCAVVNDNNDNTTRLNESLLLVMLHTATLS